MRTTGVNPQAHSLEQEMVEYTQYTTLPAVKTEGGIEKTERETEAQARRGKTEGKILAQMIEKIGGMLAMGIENAAQRPLVMGGL